MTSGQSADVLVVDDDEGVREVLQRILERAGYHVRTATHSHDALRQIRESTPAVVVTDIHMPGPSGVWLSQQIREESPRTAVVLVTTDRNVPATASMRKGIVAYLIKPFEPSQVLASVADAYRWWAQESGGEMPALVPAHPASAGAAGIASSIGAVATAPAPPKPRTVPLKVVVIAAVIIVVIVAALLYWMSRGRGGLLSQVAASSGMVLLYDGAGKNVTQGSGFFLTRDIFVTNRHVVTGGIAARIVVGDEEYPVTGAVATDAEHDLVLLKTARPGTAYLRLSSTDPAMGEAIAVYGAPRGLKGTLSTGIVSANRSDPNALVQITAPISPGNSGSPVIDASGAVIGVVVSSAVLAQGIHFAIPTSRVKSLLEQASDVRPLVAVSRGAGDDRERNELIGPVRLATISGANPGELIFDRNGRLLERRDNVTTVRYQYDDQGRLASETHLKGETAVETWTFTAIDPRIVEATERPSGRVKRLEYALDGRLRSEDVRLGGRTLSEAVWRYSAESWPTTTPAADGDKQDAIGNPTRRVLADGSTLTYSYRFDSRGNWVWREAIRDNADGRRGDATIDTRTIQYWDDVSN